MSERAKNRVFVLVIAVAAVALLALTLTYETPDDRVERLGNSIKCPVCQGESIANSPATMATDMMALVSERVDQGLSDEAIISELLDSYSGAVLLDPPLSGATLVLWVAPLAALIVGVGIIAWWRRHPGPDNPSSGAGVDESRGRSGKLAVALILVGGFAAIVVIANVFVRDRPDTTSGAADVGIESLEDVSNETMEAVIAANLDNPQINGMRLALAERYFTIGDYRSAFPHYLSVAEAPEASPAEESTALTRLAWMAYDGNGEVETATTLLDQALAITPESSLALYLKGQVLWCGAGEAEAASELFAEVLTLSDLPDETRSQVEQDLEMTRSGEQCP